MDSGWIAALASLISAVIVAATAIAAFAQLRHYRNANDIVVYLRFIEQMDSEATRAARDDLLKLTERARTDPIFRARLADPADRIEEMRAAGALLRYLEHISVLVVKGGIAEELILAEYAEMFVETWERVRDVVVPRRQVFGPHTSRAFEHLAMRSKRYIDSGAMTREYDALERDPLAH